MSGPITITLSDVEWMRLAIVIKVMRAEATTVPGAQILGDLGLAILNQVEPQLRSAADHSSGRKVGEVKG